MPADFKFRTFHFGATRTEDEWRSRAQSWIEHGSNAWFTWLRWILTAGAFAYLAKTTGDGWLLIVQYVSLLMLGLYFAAFFGSMRVEPWHTRLRDSTTRRAKLASVLLSLAIGGAAVFGAQRLIEHVVQILAAHHT